MVFQKQCVYFEFRPKSWGATTAGIIGALFGEIFDKVLLLDKLTEHLRLVLRSARVGFEVSEGRVLGSRRENELDGCFL
jgi:hypothetical protein